MINGATLVMFEGVQKDFCKKFGSLNTDRKYLGCNVVFSLDKQVLERPVRFYGLRPNAVL